MKDKNTIKAELAKLELDSSVQQYKTLLTELSDLEESEKQEAEKVKLQKLHQKWITKNSNIATFLSNLKVLVLNILNSVYIPDKDDAWLTEFPEWPEDIKIDISSLENFFDSYYSSSGKDFFAEIAANVLLRIQHNDTIYVSMHTDDDHYYDDLVEYEYNGNFNNIVNETIVSSALEELF